MDDVTRAAFNWGYEYAAQYIGGRCGGTAMSERDKQATEDFASGDFVPLHTPVEIAERAVVDAAVAYFYESSSLEPELRQAVDALLAARAAAGEGRK